MKKFLLSLLSIAGLLSVAPAFAQSCYCNLYGSDGQCSDTVCYNGPSYGSSYYGNYNVPYNYNNTYYNSTPYYGDGSYMNANGYYNNSSYYGNYNVPYYGNGSYNGYYGDGSYLYYNNSSYVPPVSTYNPYYYNSSYANTYTGNVSVTVSSSDDQVEPGDTITYTIRLRNSNFGSQNVAVVAYLDNNETFSSASNGGQRNGSNQVIWNSVPMGVNGVQTLTLRARVRSSANDGDTIRLRVRADGDEATETTDVVDNSSNNNDNSVHISLTDSPDPVSVGDTLTYTIRVRNEMNHSASLNVRAILDGDTSFISASDGGDENGNNVNWNNLTLSAGDTESITLRVRVRSTARPGDSLRLLVESGNADQTIYTNVDNGGNYYENGYYNSSSYNNGTYCTYYNSYGQPYTDYCY